VPKILVLYYSRTGNTEKMAEAVAEGAKTVQGTEVTLAYYVKPEELAEFDAIAVGVPTYHHDMTTNMKKLFEETAIKNISLKGKVGAAFGSYGWSGEAPRMVLEIMRNKFEMRIMEPPLIIKYTPSRNGLAKCEELGRQIAEESLKRAN